MTTAWTARRATTVVAVGDGALPACAGGPLYAWTTTMTASRGTAGIPDPCEGYRELDAHAPEKVALKKQRPLGTRPRGLVRAVDAASSASPRGSARAAPRLRTRGGPPRSERRGAPGSAPRPAPRRDPPRVTGARPPGDLPGHARPPWGARWCGCPRVPRQAPSP